MDKELRAARNEMFNHPYYAQCNSEYKSLQYCRYADDFIIGVIGSKQDAEQIKTDVKNFLAEELKLTLSEEKTKITHTSEFARFLGYDICISRSYAIKYNGKGVAKREYSGRVMMYVPKEKWVGKLQEYHTFKIVTDENGKEKWKTIHRGKLRLFLEWGITFGEPYILPERAARKVAYADKRSLMRSIRAGTSQAPAHVPEQITSGGIEEQVTDPQTQSEPARNSAYHLGKKGAAP